MSNPKAKRIFLPNKFLSFPYAKTATYIMLSSTFNFGQNASEYDITRIRKTTVIVQPFIALGEYKSGVSLKTELFTKKKKLPSFIFGLSYGNNNSYALSFGLRKYALSNKKISFLIASNIDLGEADFKVKFISLDSRIYKNNENWLCKY